jgi:hypothetical protein
MRRARPASVWTGALLVRPKKRKSSCGEYRSGFRAYIQGR